MKAIYITLAICIVSILVVYFLKKNSQKSGNGKDENINSLNNDRGDEIDIIESQKGGGELIEQFGMAVSPIKEKINNPSATIANKGICERACEARYPFSRTKRNNCKSNCK